jgi:predicted DNA-binding transcriptional regulator AlpA
VTTATATDLLTQPVRDYQAQLLDVRAVAALLDCSARHVYRLADAGRMPPPVRIGALVRWRRSTGDPTTGIEDWIAGGCRPVRPAGRAQP